MSTKATPSDAEIVLKLYDLRREPVMREARDWFAQKFNPQSADEVLAVGSAWGTQENAYYRQVVSFWEMAASLVIHGAVHPDLFMDWGGEMIFVFAKFYPYLAEIREKSGNPNFLAKAEKVIYDTGREPQLKAMLAMFEKFAAQLAASK